MIRCVIMVTRSLRNLPWEASNEHRTHLILRGEVRANFGCLACQSTTWSIKSSRANNWFWKPVQQVGLTSLSQTPRASFRNGRRA
jgi:hypothetical protein